MGFLSSLTGGGVPTWTNSDGLVSIKARENPFPTAIDSLREINASHAADYRAKNGGAGGFGFANQGSLVGASDFSSLPAVPNVGGGQSIGGIMGSLGPLLQRAGQALGQGQQPLQMADTRQQPLDPFAMLRNVGIDPMSNYLGRLGRY